MFLRIIYSSRELSKSTALRSVCLLPCFTSRSCTTFSLKPCSESYSAYLLTFNSAFAGASCRLHTQTSHRHLREACSGSRMCGPPCPVQWLSGRAVPAERDEGSRGLHACTCILWPIPAAIGMLWPRGHVQNASSSLRDSQLRDLYICGLNRQEVRAVLADVSDGLIACGNRRNSRVLLN